MLLLLLLAPLLRNFPLARLDRIRHSLISRRELGKDIVRRLSIRIGLLFVRMILKSELAKGKFDLDRGRVT